MKFFVLLFGLAALTLRASSIDISAQTAVMLPTGDSLTFTVSDRSFALDAATFGYPTAPTQVVVQLLSSFLVPGAQLDAVLESTDGAVSASFGYPLAAAAGIFQGSGYHGSVADFEGSQFLPEALSQQLFAGNSARLVLLNPGPDIRLGLAPYDLQQAIMVTLAGNAGSFSAADGGVWLGNVPPEMPEPESEALLVGGGVLLYLISAFLKRISHPCIQ